MGKLEPYPAHPVTFISAAPPGGGWYQLCEQTVRALREEDLLPVEVRMEEQVPRGGYAPVHGHAQGRSCRKPLTPNPEVSQAARGS